MIMSQKQNVTSTSQRLRDEFAFLLLFAFFFHKNVRSVEHKTQIWVLFWLVVCLFAVSRLSLALCMQHARALMTRWILRFSPSLRERRCYRSVGHRECVSARARVRVCVRAQTPGECVREEGADARNVFLLFFSVWNRLLKWEKRHRPSSSL